MILGIFMNEWVLLGPAGSFSDVAADRLRFRGKRKYCASFAELLKCVMSGKIGLLPMRNKLVGDIAPVSKFLKQEKIRILRKIRLPVNFVMAAQKRIPFSAVKNIFSSPIAAAQCRKFIKKTLSGAHFYKNFDSTAETYKKIVQLRGKMANNSAAIGSEKGAKIYRLIILARKIQDDPDDWTEFVLVQAVTAKKTAKTRRSAYKKGK